MDSVSIATPTSGAMRAVSERRTNPASARLSGLVCSNCAVDNNGCVAPDTVEDSKCLHGSTSDETSGTEPTTTDATTTTSSTTGTTSTASTTSATDTSTTSETDTAIDGLAVWKSGDPGADFDGTARPNSEGGADFAGADRP